MSQALSPSPIIVGTNRKGRRVAHEVEAVEVLSSFESGWGAQTAERRLLEPAQPKLKTRMPKED